MRILNLEKLFSFPSFAKSGLDGGQWKRGDPVLPNSISTSKEHQQMTKVKRAVAEAINPATGRPDLTGALRHVLTKLNEEDGIQKGALYHVLNGGLQSRVQSFGIPNTYLVDFVLLMQDLGLARHRGAHTVTVWEVVDVKFFDEFVTKEWLRRALDNLQKRHEKNAVHVRLRQRVERLESEGAQRPSVPSTHIEQMAEMVAEVERLSELNNAKNAEITSLKAELASRPKDDPEAVVEALVSRFRKSKAS